VTWLYLALNIGSISVPFLFSFDKRVGFYHKWKFLFPALIITATFFIIWDFWFTEIGIWKFNYEYVTGLNLVNLPVEEWMFFLFIPYACVFIHESLKYYLPKAPLENYGKQIALVLAAVLLVTAYIHSDRMYTVTTFTLLGLFLLLNVFAFRSWFLGRFFFTYLISLIPFAVVNGILTSMPVLIYNDSENLGIRLGTIPLEDCFYSMLMLLINITIFEHLMRSRKSELPE
jgi:lycopene cyclase domain-containing protein